MEQKTQNFQHSSNTPNKKKLAFWPLFLIILGLALGFIVTLQARSSVARIANPVLPYVSLKDTKEALLAENDNLSDESAILQKEIVDLQEGLKGTQNLDQGKLDELNRLKQITGLTEVSGGGFEIILNDAPQFQDGTNSIAHAADLRDLINVLWLAGSQDIVVNDQRIVASTSIDCIVNTVMINNIRTVPPFRILAIGNREKIEAALRDQEKLKNIYERVVKTGLVFEFQPIKNLVIPTFGGNFIIEKARVL